jgi:hypothetical protein
MPWQAVSVSAEPNSGHTGTAAHTSTSEAVVSAAAASDDDLLAYLISLLISDRPMITEEQVDNERAKMTDDERVEFLVDLFGKQCDISTPRNKKANRDLDKNSIDFLIKMMKLELERIPNDRKGALLEAQIRCRADEFSDSRLERFLRCEGRNPKVRLEVVPFLLLQNQRVAYCFVSVTMNGLAGSTAFCELLGVPTQSLWAR